MASITGARPLPPFPSTIEADPAPLGYWRLKQRIRLYHLGAPAAKLAKISAIERWVAKPDQLVSLASILAETGDLTGALALVEQADRREPGIFDRHRYLALTYNMSLLSNSFREKYARDVEIYEHAAAHSGAFASIISQNRSSICVVGNSPVEIGRASGESIDRHEVVIRFNNFSTEKRYAADYGTKLDVWVRVPGYGELLRRKIDARLVVFPTPVAWRTPNGQDGFAEYEASGAAIDACPSDVIWSLAQRTNSPPSSGLAILWWISLILGDLEGVDTFGFSMSDQKEGSRHYFSEKVGPHSAHHKWDSERAFFDKLIARQ